MEKENARRQTLEQLRERRKQVVRLHKQGIKVMQIVQMTGLSYPTVRAAIDLFDTGSWSAVRPALRGRAIGDGRVRSIGKYLTRWGFTPQKPIKRAYEQSPAAMQAWLKGEYPAIEQRARSEGAEIDWGNETARVFTDVRGRNFALAGKTPVAMAVGGTRQKLSMIATVTNQGEVRWMIIDEAFDAEKRIEFLAALIKDARKKVFLILDNLRVHHSKLVKVWLAERLDQIELFYLPSYSPQLKPEERLNADLENEMGKRVPVRTKAKLREAANEHMAMLEQNPQRVMSYFQDRRVRCAA